MGQANGLLMLYGTIGTTVSQGSEVGNYITGDSYATDDAVTFSHISANGVDIEISSIDGVFQLAYTIDGKLSQSPNIVVQKGVTDTTITADC